MAEGQTPFQVEGWVEWSLGVAIILLRLYARWKAVGFKGWKGDDYFSVIALVLWTVSHGPPMTLARVFLGFLLHSRNSQVKDDDGY